MKMLGSCFTTGVCGKMNTNKLIIATKEREITQLGPACLPYIAQ